MKQSMRQTARTRSGSTLIYGIAGFIAVVVLFGYIALNYQQLFSYQKQAQTSIDAAAIAVAKDVQRVTVLDPRVGRVGVVDQYGTAGLEQTIRQKLPSDFQTAEYLLKHGQVDMVVDRGQLKDRLASLIAFHDRARTRSRAQAV